MPLTNEKIKAAQKALDESSALYEDGKKKYDAVTAAYEVAKVASAQANSFVSTLKNTQLDTTAALTAAAAFAPDPQQYASQINQPGVNPQEVQKQALNDGVKKANVAEIAKKKAEKEVQQATRYLNGIKNRINVIKNQLGIATSGKDLTKNAEQAEVVNNKIIKADENKVSLNSTRVLLNENKAAIKAVAKAATLYITAKILNSEVRKLSKVVQQLSQLVDTVNEQIESIQTKQDVLKARITRDAALIALNDAERQVDKVRKTIKTLETILTIVSLVVKILLSFSIPTTPKIVQKIVNTIMLIDAIVILLGITRISLENLIAEIQYERSRLLPISDIIDRAINNNLTPEEIGALLNRAGDFGQLGPLGGVVYRGFTFAIYEEDDPRYVVAGNKRRYAVALDRSGFITLRSQPSFTLDPEVLVNELKLRIDEQNLES